MRTSVYIADSEQLRPEEYYELALKCVSSARKEKTLRFKPLSDRLTSLGAELLLIKALFDLGFKDVKPEFCFGPNEKPYLSNLKDVFFNISHSGRYVICAVSDREIGCDIEKICDNDLKIAKRFFCREEYERILSLSSPEKRTDLFYRYWTLKESVIKACGKGLALELDSFRIDLDAGRPSLAVVKKEKAEDLAQYSVEELAPPAGYRASFCQLGEISGYKVEYADLVKILLQITEK